ncbi:hypothetical protein LZ30DRAFT_406309 [Colletotrichum cereale]|nr:hypothetical protein LZ30DRAFT_406309 [Colletotrichum cereale]
MNPATWRVCQPSGKLIVIGGTSHPLVGPRLLPLSLGFEDWEPRGCSRGPVRGGGWRKIDPLPCGAGMECRPTGAVSAVRRTRGWPLVRLAASAAAVRGSAPYLIFSFLGGENDTDFLPICMQRVVDTTIGVRRCSRVFFKRLGMLFTRNAASRTSGLVRR